MRRLLAECGRRTRRLAGERFPAEHRDRGAGFVEYAGLLLLIAAIVVAVLALNLDVQVANAVRDAIGDILGGD